MNKSIIEIKNITKKYDDIYALDNISFELPDKGFIFVNGISGSGKTTLMNIMSGLDISTKGQILYNGDNILDFSAKKLDNYKNTEIGIVFQNFNLIEEMTVEENLLLPLNIQKTPKEEKINKVQAVLEYVGLKEYGKRKGYELSAGQRQRVAIARAIVKTPKILFADEATGNLDRENTEQILKLFNKISKKCLVILISHNELSAQKYGDHIITLSDGKIENICDNTMLKKMYLDSYNVVINGHGYINKVPLEDFDLKLEMKNVAELIDNEVEQYTFTTEISHGKQVKIDTDINWLQKTNAQSLDVSTILQMAGKMFYKEKFRNILSIFIISFVTTLFMTLYVVTNNDYSKSIYHYIVNNIQHLYSTEMRMENSENNMSYKISNGKKLYTCLKNIVGRKNIVKTITDQEICINDSTFNISEHIYADYFNTFKIEGKWPQNFNDIVITSKLQKSVGANIGDIAVVNDIDCTIVGIINDMNNYNIILSENYNPNITDNVKVINLETCNILTSADFDNYIYEIALLGRQTNINDNNIIWGRNAIADNEIVVGANFLENNQIDINGTFIKKYRLPNLYDKKYKGQFDEKINLFDFLGKNIEIVGVYNDAKSDLGNILINDKKFEDIVSYYREYLGFNSYSICLDNVNKEMLNSFDYNNIFLKDNVCSCIYSVKDFTNDMRNILTICTIIMFIIVIMVIISYLSYNIKRYSKTIGIYKSLGIQNSDVIKVFMFSQMTTSIISIILTNIFVMLIIDFSNKKIVDFFDQNFFRIFELNFYQCILLNLTIIIINVIAIISPLHKLMKRESISLLNKETY